MNELNTKDTREILKEISQLKASDIFVVAGRPLSYRLNNQIREYSQERLQELAGQLDHTGYLRHGFQPKYLSSHRPGR